VYNFKGLFKKEDLFALCYNYFIDSVHTCVQGSEL